MKKTLAALFALLFFAVPGLADAELSVSHWYEDDGTEYAVFTAYDENGAILWQLETAADQIGELDAISWFETGLGGHRLLVNVTNYGLSCYDAESGDLVWHIPVAEYSFGGGCCFAADAAGNVYAGGYYGPDPLCISPEGEILWFSDHGLDQDIYWLYQMLMLDEGLIAVYDGWFDGDDMSDVGGYVIYGADGTAVSSGIAEFSPYLSALYLIEKLETGAAGSSLKLAAASALVLNRIEGSGYWDEEFFIRIADAYVDSMSDSARAAFAEKFAAADEFIRLILAGDESAIAQVGDAGGALGYARFSPEKYDLLYTAVTQALEE